MPGYATNIALTESGLYLRVALKNKFVNGNTCYEKIKELSQKFKNGELLRALQNYFKGASVMSNYGNHKVYKVDEVTERTVKTTMVLMRDIRGNPQEITLEKYYKDQYNRVIEHPDQFVFISYKKLSGGEKMPLYLVPELMLMTGMDEDMLNNENLKKTMTLKTKLTPKDRMAKIWDFKKLLYKQNSRKQTRTNRSGEEITLSDPNDLREQWGFNISDFKEFKGRQLEAPGILYQGEISQISGGKFRGKKLIAPEHLSKTVWAVFVSPQNKQTAHEMVKQLQAASRNLGVNVEEPNVVPVDGRNASNWIDFFKDSRERLSNLKIAMVILDRYTKSFYRDIKRYIYCNVGIPVQNVLKENSVKNLSYYSNVLCQMIAKMGGRPYSINIDENLHKNV